MIYDLAIIGGGINGTAIAREAARNGLSVILLEKDDLASHTSSASTKLIHGGLRYLEYFEFRLVREALKEREVLLRQAPHLIYPLQFVLPHEHAVRPWWLVRLGLWLYDHIGGRISLPRSRGLNRRDRAFIDPLKRDSHKGFVYSDCWVDDARLVVMNALDAQGHGADIRTRTAVSSARRQEGAWQLSLANGEEVSAHSLVNAAGPWVAQMLARTGANSQSAVRLVKGSHIIVPRLFEGQHAYMLQQPDGRIVFAIAYEDGTTLVGTTDEQVNAPEDARISDAEIDYLCAAVNRYFVKQTAPADVIGTFSGVRPLYDDGASEAKAVTRDYVLELDSAGPALLSVFGGKITTARHLAEEAVQKLAAPSGWTIRPATRDAILPGGHLDSPFDAFLAKVMARWPFLGAARAQRMARAYGAILEEMLADVGSEADMGEDFGAGLTQIEVDWLIRHEWARTAEDILLRRTKIGLSIDAQATSRLKNYVDLAVQNKI
ncbi:MAG: glycerol-3-phosphate dehydrogenase [Chakrabartia sp.]